LTTTVYVDNAIVGALARGQGGQDERIALGRVLDAGREGRLNLITSAVTGEEIARIPEEHRHPHRAIYQLLSRVPTAREVGADRMLLLGVGGRPRDPMLVELQQLLTKNDARHVFQAVKNNADVFLTLDGGIIHHAKVLEGRGIRVMKPTVLVADLGLV
jgi:hypothetical protein